MKLFVRLAGLAVFLVLFVFSIIFYKERTITYDLAFQNFYLVITKTFVLNWVRVGAVIPQMIPLIFIWLGYPLKYVLLSHSVSFVLFFASFFLIITFYLHEQKAAIIFLLFLLLLVNDTFYWTMSELSQGLAFLILYFAWLEKVKPLHIANHPLLHFFLLLFIQFFHPLLIVPILFVLLYSVYKNSGINLSQFKKPVLIAMLCFVIRFAFGRFDAYERTKLNAPWHGLLNLPHLFNLPSTHKLVHFAGSDYLVYWLLFITTLIFLIKQKRLFIALLVSSFTLGHLILICATNPIADKFYLENMLLPCSIFLLLPFADFIWLRFFSIRPVLAGAFLLAIISSRLCFIYNAHNLYTSRLAWYNSMFQIMEKNNTQRLMSDTANAPMDTLVMPWPSGYESLLLSSIGGPRKAKSLIVDGNLSQFASYMEGDTLLITKWETWPIRKLPENYFSFDKGKYIIYKP